MKGGGDYAKQHSKRTFHCYCKTDLKTVSYTHLDVYKRQNMHSVGVMGDERTYDYAVALRAVTTTDFMTAESYNMPWDVLGTVTSLSLIHISIWATTCALSPSPRICVSRPRSTTTF